MPTCLQVSRLKVLLLKVLIAPRLPVRKKLNTMPGSDATTGEARVAIIRACRMDRLQAVWLGKEAERAGVDDRRNRNYAIEVDGRGYGSGFLNNGA